jgi:hypothetical protein
VTPTSSPTVSATHREIGRVDFRGTSLWSSSEPAKSLITSTPSVKERRPRVRTSAGRLDRTANAERITCLELKDGGRRSRHMFDEHFYVVAGGLALANPHSRRACRWTPASRPAAIAQEVDEPQVRDPVRRRAPGAADALGRRRLRDQFGRQS